MTRAYYSLTLPVNYNGFAVGIGRKNASAIYDLIQKKVIVEEKARLSDTDKCRERSRLLPLLSNLAGDEGFDTVR
jgi:hypothetical protein